MPSRRGFIQTNIFGLGLAFAGALRSGRLLAHHRNYTAERGRPTRLLERLAALPHR